MESLSLVIGVIGNVISVLMFLSPISTFWRIIKQRSTQEFESLPYICTLLNCSLWTYYGLMKSGELLVATVNGFGVVVEAIYLSIFLIYAPQNMRAHRFNSSCSCRDKWPNRPLCTYSAESCSTASINTTIIFFLHFYAKTAILVGILDVGFLAVAIMVTQLALKGDDRIDAMGIMGAGLNIIMYASPLAAMKTVVTTKSVEFMPFFLSFFFFLNGGVWAFYAILLQDYILLVPNGTGFILGSAQLVLYAVYRKAKPSKNGLINGLLEEGHQHEHLILPSDQIISQQES